MSYGVGGWAYLTLENESIVQYKYGSFDWNVPEHYNDDKICDGKITIHKDLFSKFPERSQWGLKRVIEVRNCSNCWSKTTDEFEIDFVALGLIGKIFKEYDISNLFPEKCTFCK